MSNIIKNRCFFKRLWLTVTLIGLSFPAAAMETDGHWLLIDLAKQRVILYSGSDRKIKQFSNISIGRAGVSQLHFKGDKTTPIGNYRVTHINTNSRFRTFIGLNYPTSEHAKQAYLLGKISAQELNALLYAERTNSPPPSDTALGGMIGIHALGMANPRIHGLANWTEGCIALSNDQIDELLPYVREGTRVIIQ